MFLREFVLGRNETGLVTGDTAAIGGENSTLAGDILPGGNLLFYGSSSTAGTTTIPLVTQQAWASFLATATITISASATGTATGSSSAAISLTAPALGMIGIMNVLFIMLSL